MTRPSLHEANMSFLECAESALTGIVPDDGWPARLRKERLAYSQDFGVSTSWRPIAEVAVPVGGDEVARLWAAWSLLGAVAASLPTTEERRRLRLVSWAEHLRGEWRTLTGRRPPAPVCWAAADRDPPIPLLTMEEA